MPSPRHDPRKTSAWRQLRRWWQAQLPLPCPRCGRTIQADDLFDLDHVVPISQGGTWESARPAHRSCNRRHGQSLGQKLPPEWAQLAGKDVPTTSRDW